MDSLDLGAGIVLVLTALASARIWRGLIIDDVGLPVRFKFGRFVEWLRPDPRNKEERRKHWRRNRAAEILDEGFYCSFCSGFWITLAVLATALAWHDQIWWQLLAGALAVNYVTGHLNSKIDRVTFDDEEFLV